MGFALPLISSFLLISSSLANPIPLDRAASLSTEDISLLEQNAQQTIQIAATDKLTCDSSADRCLLFPIGCVSGVNCTDRLEMRIVDSGSHLGDILISLNLHVPRTPHMLVAIPMPDLSNPNSTFLVGCSIDEAAAVIARPDVDGVTEQLHLPWLRLVSVRATSSDLECIVSASRGFVDLPIGDVAVFAGHLEPEEEVRQSARISGSLDDSDETREHVKSRERVEVESSIQKISPPTSSLERTTPSESHEPTLVHIEDQRFSTTEWPSTTTVILSKKSNKLRFKMLHSSESSSAERHSQRHSSAETTHSTHRSVHPVSTSTTTTEEPTSRTEAPEPEETTVPTTEAPSTPSPEQSKTVIKVDEPTTVLPHHHHEHHADTHLVEADKSTTVHPRHQLVHQEDSDKVDGDKSTTIHPHHQHVHHEESRKMEDGDKSTTVHPNHQNVHHEESRKMEDGDKSTTVHPNHQHVLHEDSHEHHKERHSHERATVDKEHHSVRMTAGTTTTTKKPATFEDDENLSEEEKQILRAVQEGHVKNERRDEEEEGEEETEPSHHDSGSDHHKHATMYELTREAAEDPIGRRPNEHSHSTHSHELRAADDEEEEKEEHTRKEVVHHEREKEEEREGENEGRQKMGEKKHQRRSEETEDEDEEEEEDEDDATSSFSLIIPMIVCLAPVLFG